MGRRATWAVALGALLALVPVAPVSAAAPSLVAGQLTFVPLGSTTLSIGGRPYRGNVVAATDPAGLAVVDRVDFEDYVDGIAEVPTTWPAAALEAQAVAARTYALWVVLTHPMGPAGGQICATDACQVYAGAARGADRAWRAAVTATREQVLLFGGRVIEALYGSSDGGSTASGGVPWLPAVGDPDDALAPEHTWSWSAPVATLAPALGVPAGQTLVGLDSSATAVTEAVQGADGSTATVALDPSRFRLLLNTKVPPPGGLDLPLPSSRFTVATDTGVVSVSGAGDGNLLGLSQYGALGKAQRGMTAGQILAAYYGPARPAALPAGQVPTMIGVTVADGPTSVTVSADGPVRIHGPAGAPLATTTGASSWQLTGGAVVQATQTSGAVTAAVPPPHAAPSAAVPAATTVTAPVTTAAPAPTTTAGPAPAAGAAPPAGAGPLAVAAVSTGRLTSSTPPAHPAGRRTVPAAWYLLAGAALVAAAGATLAVGRRHAGRRPGA